MEMSKKPEEDEDLFRQAMQGAQPLADDNRVHARINPAKPRLQKRPSDALQMHDQLLEQEAQSAGMTLDIDYRRPGIQDRLLRKLRTGKIPREDELDLHGLNVDQARKQLACFLTRCQQHQLRCVRIIHGKGLRSGERGAVLKQQVARWLQNHEMVLAACEARREEGGSGATILWLRKTGTD